jgi:23S rRNA (pseudouridine1915-N3)-methyltransferase
MKLNIISVGHKMPAWVELAFQEYKKRFPPQFSVTLTEIFSKIRHTSTPIQKIIEDEGEKILASLPKKAVTIALDEHGKQWDTQEFSKKIKAWQHETPTVNFLIGGPDGLSKTCLSTADDRWSLSPLTLPHPLVRIILIEQLYRAVSILHNHPYHRT